MSPTTSFEGRYSISWSLVYTCRGVHHMSCECRVAANVVGAPCRGMQMSWVTCRGMYIYVVGACRGCILFLNYVVGNKCRGEHVTHDICGVTHDIPMSWVYVVGNIWVYRCIVKTIFIGKFRGWIASDFKIKLVQFEAEKKRQLFSTLEYNIC